MKDKIFKSIVVIAVLLVPFMYSFFYLKSYWNPYGNLSDLGVAIVNNDTTSDESLSEDFIKGLKDSDTCNFQVVDSETANEGLINGDYYAIVTIPEKFTDNINNIGEKDRQITTITYSPNQKTNYLASQIISRIIVEAESSLENSISSGVVGTLVDSLNEVPDSLDKIVDASSTIEEGSNKLSSGLSEINDGTSKLANKYTELDEGINNAKDGVSTLSSGIDALINGTSDLSKGSKELKNGINDYTSNASAIINLAAGFCQVDPTTYNSYLNMYSNGQINCSNISYIASTLNKGADTLKQGSSILVSGVDKLQEGENQLKGGVSVLSSGLDKLSTGSNTVKQSLNTLANGTKNAYDGSVSLSNGVSTFKNEIVSRKEETKEKISKLDGIKEYMENPVEISEEPVGEVNEYGVSFTPLFLSIGLWVGALMCYVVFFFDQERRFKLLDKENRGIKQNFIYIGLSVIYGFVTAFLLKNILGFNAVSSVTYYLSSILISITFMAIIQFLIRVFGDVGKFLALIILVLQLASSGGTFPVETISQGFRYLTNYLPMTYSIRLVKETIISTDQGLISNNVIMLFAFALITLALTTIYDLIKNKKKIG